MKSQESTDLVYGEKKQRVSVKIGEIYKLVKFVVDSKSMPGDIVSYSD